MEIKRQRQLTEEEKTYKEKLSISRENNKLTRELSKWTGLKYTMAFCMPITIISSVSLPASLIVAVLFAAIIIPISFLRYALYEKLGLRELYVAPICMVVSMGLIAYEAVLIKVFIPQVTNILGNYLYLFAAYTVVYSVMENGKTSGLKKTFMLSLRNIIYFTSVVVVTAIIREVIVSGRFIIWELPFSVKFSGGVAPFFGMIILGGLLALIGQQRLRRIGRRYKVKRTAAEREV